MSGGGNRGRFWTTARIHRAGLFAILGGLLYAVGVPAVPGVPLTESRLLAAVVELLAVASLLFALGAVHARYGNVYERTGLVVWALTVVAIGAMALGSLLSLAPLLGVSTPELGALQSYLRIAGPLVAALGGTVFGVVLWRAGAARPGSGLLSANAFLGFGGAALLSGFVSPEVAVSVPFGLAWSFVGHSLWANRAMPSRLRPKKPNVGW